jgi:putative proteasome-type protease
MKGGQVTYCIGILLDEGVVLASDSRTNAGIDRVSTFRKMFVFEKPGGRFFALATAGNLSLTQGVISLVGEWLNNENPEQDLFAASSMFGAARIVGNALREIHKIDGGYLQQHEVDFSASFILAGQIKGGQLRLFMVYDAGNFIEAMGDTTYFQIGEVKYGKPILDRVIRHDTSLADAAKCALISFDSTMRSNVSVGPPLDLLIYRRNSLQGGFKVRLEDDDPYLQAIREGWGAALLNAFHHISHDPGWAF